MRITLPLVLETAIAKLIEQGYRPVLVGGYVRDTLLNLPSKDIDIELFGVENLEVLEPILATFGKVNSVGKSFGVLKLQLGKIEVDFSIPRQEKKIARGHKGFEVRLDASLSFKAAAKRRDFSINAMGYDLITKRLLDPFHGQEDLRVKRLDIVDEVSFIEDPLRLYRAMQFVARFELTPSTRFMRLAKEMIANNMLAELPKERVFEEFKKLFLKSKQPSLGLTLLHQCNMLEHFAELKALIGVQQDPTYHPEGDVWRHTLMVVDEMYLLHGADEKQNLYLSFAALCHDLGKANTTKVIGGRIRSIGHENSGIALSEQFLARLTQEQQLIDKVLTLVKHHLKPRQFYTQGAKSAAIRRLARQVNIAELVLLARADALGRTTEDALRREFKAGEWLLERAKNLHVVSKPLDPLLQGRDLIKVGLQPSKVFKTVLDKAYEAQLEGDISTHTEAILWLQKELSNP